MLEGKRIAVVVPAHNEARLLGRVIATMPTFVDLVVVVDDDSHDETFEVARRAAAIHPTDVVVLSHDRTSGPGAAIRTGYRAALAGGAEVIAVMAGDGQMDPADLARLVEPVLRGEADYAKGDRLSAGRRPTGMPVTRYVGVGALTRLTRLVTGYGSLTDTQSGYTAASAECLSELPLEHLYPGYGYPNHLLILLQAAGKQVVDIPVRAVYGVGERSELRAWRVALPLLLLLARGALGRFVGAVRDSDRDLPLSPPWMSRDSRMSRDANR